MNIKRKYKINKTKKEHSRLYISLTTLINLYFIPSHINLIP